VEPRVLITTLSEAYDRISMHGVRRELLLRQSHALAIPLAEVRLPLDCSDQTYEACMASALASPPLGAIEEVAFGDLFLADVRAYRERQLRASAKTASFPLWGCDTAVLAARFVAAGFRATVVCVDPRLLDASFAGRAYDEQLLADLPASVDPCGENGEFHTFVHAGPIFAQPILCQPGEVVLRDGFVFSDMIAA
jgi:diphthamide synthase (EF-2-diphthine--ammonia ligase)